MVPDIPKKMKAIQVVEFKKPYQVREVEVPDPSKLQEHDLLVKVAVASNCHTDSMVQQGVFGRPLPQTASHEGSGTIVALGSTASQKFSVGDRVMCGIPCHPCGSCADCTGPESQRQYCTYLEGHIGVQIDGCFAEYVLCDARSSTKMPDEVTFQSAAPLACAGRTVYRSVLKAGLKKGEWLAFVGSGGGLGHLGIQFAKALGLKVIGVDARDEGLELSRKYGADVVMDARKGKEKVVEETHTAIGNERGVDAAITLSDHKDAAAIACAMTKMHGTMVQIAQPDIIEIPFPEIIFRDIRVVGSLICSGEESEDMLRVIAKHGVTVTTVPFDGLDKIGELVELVHSGRIQGKAVIIVDKQQIEDEKKIGAKY